MRRYGRFVVCMMLCLLAAASGLQTRERTKAGETGKGNPTIATGSLPIHIVYLHTPDGGREGMPGVWEVNVANGARRIVLASDKWPAGFVTRPGLPAASPNGDYLAIWEETDVVSDDNAASGVAIEGMALKVIGGRVWLLDLRDGSLKRVFSSGSGPDIAWSPSGRFLSTVSDDNVLVYDTHTGKTGMFSHEEDTPFAWSGDGDNLLLHRKFGKGLALYLQPADGSRAKLLLARSPLDLHFAQSPSRERGYADSDGKQVRLLSSAGKLMKTFKIPDQLYRLDDDIYYTAFSFDPSSRHLAVLTDCAFGEPHINEEQQLWWIDMSPMKAARVGKWTESYVGISESGGEYVNRGLAGWAPDGHTILVSGRVDWGGDGACDNRTDWYRLWSYDISQPKAKGKLIFDSGSGCYGLTWW